MYGGIVSGCNKAGVKRIRFQQQLFPLDLPVADHAGIWRLAVEVFLNKIPDHFFAERFRKIEDVVWNSQRGGNEPGVINSIQRTAARVVLRSTSHILVVECFQCNADNIVSLLHEHRRSGGRIHSAAHADNDSFAVFIFSHVVKTPPQPEKLPAAEECG